MNYSTMSLEDMWQGICLGESAMQKNFYYKTYSLFFAICNRYAPNSEDAEQWLNDGYIKIFNNAGKYNRVGSLEGWLKRIIVNTCLDNLRQLKTQYNSVHMHTKDPDNYHQSFSIANDALLQIDSQELLDYIKELPDTQRTVFNMYALEGYSHKEISEALGIKEANSQWHLNRARNLLKEKIASKKKLLINSL